APAAGAWMTVGDTRAMNHCAADGDGPPSPAVLPRVTLTLMGPRSAIAAAWSIAMRDVTGAARATVRIAAAASSATATIAARAAMRPSAPDAAVDPTLAISIETTSGRTVMR